MSGAQAGDRCRYQEVSILRLPASYSVATDEDGPDIYDTIDEALDAARAILLDAKEATNGLRSAKDGQHDD